MPPLPRITYHAVYDNSPREALLYAAANGFAGIQLAVEWPHLSFESLSDGQMKEIGELRRSLNLSLSIHAPDNITPLLQPSRLLWKGSLEYFRALFHFAQIAGASLVTFHAGAIPSFKTDTIPVQQHPEQDVHEYLDSLKQNLETLVQLSGGCFLLCLENQDLTEPVQQTIEPLLNEGKINLCWDLAKTEPQTEVYLTRRLSRVAQVHLHDAILDEHSKKRSHLVLGTGCIDFRRYLGLLQAADVREYCIEVRPREKAKESLRVLRELMDLAG